jgi:hypothetical protein
MLDKYEKLAPEFIETKSFLKHIKSMLKDLCKDVKIEPKISIDEFGIGVGPIVQLKHKTFICRIYSSSYGSSDKMGSCYVVMQPICKNMEAPYNKGHIIRYSLAYFANNPKYLVDNIKRVMQETELWEKAKDLRNEKVFKKPEKYFDKLESLCKKALELRKEVLPLSHSRLETFLLGIENLYLKTKQDLIVKKEIECKDRGKYKDKSFIPYKTFEKFAEKRSAKIFGQGIKYFYDKESESLFSSTSNVLEFSCIDLTYKKFKKIKENLKYTNYTLHHKLFLKHKKIFTPVTKIYLIY